jgi:hypothetical protein
LIQCLNHRVVIRRLAGGAITNDFVCAIEVRFHELVHILLSFTERFGSGARVARRLHPFVRLLHSQ